MRSTTLAMIPIAWVLSSCGTSELFGKYDLPEGPEVATAPYPRLVDVPAAPAAGSYSDEAPDPAAGRAVIDELAPVTAEQAARAEVLSAPVLTEAERRNLGK